MYRAVSKHNGSKRGICSDRQVDLAGHQDKRLTDGKRTDKRAVPQNDLNVLERKKCRVLDPGVDAQRDQWDRDADLRREQHALQPLRIE